MKYIFLDTEFTNLMNPDLISIGLITEDGNHELYMERNDYDKKSSSQFVREMVEPYLMTNGMRFNEMSARLYVWLDELPDKYQIMVDYPDDWRLFMDLLDEDLPKNIHGEPSYVYPQLETNAVMKGMKDDSMLETIIAVRNSFKDGFSDFFYTFKLPSHHALNDAKANRYGWLKAMEQLNG
jgi:hypothetical protein